MEEVVYELRLIRNRRHGSIKAGQLRMFIEVARAQIDWNVSWIDIDDLYCLIEEISQKPDNEEIDVQAMDIDRVQLTVYDLLDHMERLQVR
ncbi:hypothetical protein FRC07_009214 [Ceratobasidium sp. 392]|nr:hypothetical protein FRC07_009214 [Ceratobasidium sp. 392]